jgi:Flp pilus assembly protein TadD
MGIIESQLAQNQAQAALKMIRDELARNPDRLEYRVALANISVNAQDYRTAIAEYGKVLEKSPRNSQIWLQLAETHRRAGNWQDAVSGFKKTQELAPTDVRAFLQLALMYDTSGNRGEAKPLYEQVLRIKPDEVVALNNLAFMMADTGADLDQALTMAQKATQQRPNDGNVADTLGWIYVKKNLPDTAIGIYRKLIEQEPQRSTYRFHFGLALQMKGEKAQARKELEAALRSKPTKDEEAKIREALSKLG